MLKSIEVSAPSRELAIEKALNQLGMDRDSVSVEVLELGKRGFLGIGAVDAKIRVTYEVPDEEPAPQPAPSRPAAEKTAPASSIAPDDPRLTTPHLVKAAPPKTQTTPAPEAPARETRAPQPRREDRPARAPRTEERVYEPAVPMAEDQVPECGKKAVAFINGLLEKLDIKGQAVVTADSEPDHLRIDISGPDMGPVIGRRGDTLDAIQYLTSLVLNQYTEEHMRLTIDTENYRAKRAESLERLARKMAGKVLKYHKPMTLEPMNPYERRIIHSALQEYRGVTTYSTGTEPGRRVVIAPDGPAHPPRRGYSSRGRR